MNDNYLELYEKLSKLQWLLQRHHLHNHVHHGPMADPTRGQGRVLAILKLQEEISTKDLSYMLGIRQQSLNELLNKLEKSDYVVRVPSEADKRVMLVKLTEKGRNEQMETEPDLSGIFNCLSEQEQVTFSEYLDRIINALEAQLGDGEDHDDRIEWMRAALSRMGRERFERLMSMYGRFNNTELLRKWAEMSGMERPGHPGHCNPFDAPHFHRHRGFPFGRPDSRINDD
ncbi:MAG TPA: MarR family transcriptional regulator [Desulfitobacteriaceae bacterium]|nr:MarR family transcriptional regulator [Desulfitobacteriaceae bacterium]